MKIINEVGKMKTYARIMRKENKLVGLIPTMGYLHEGHLSLIRTVRKQADVVILSIFVNPIQFAPDEDFEKYPRDIKRDEELAKSCGVDVLFYPEKKGMYPPGFSTYVNVEELTDGLCGKSRPDHFRGVTTVVAKLFEIVKPDIAYFGQKDAQQAFVIRKMAEDLNMDVTIKILPIIREEDGVAMSSRNTRLSKPERKDASVLYKSLEAAREAVNSGERDAKKLIKKMREMITASPSAKTDYISIVDVKSLKEIPRIKGEVLIALAVFIGKTRLIDNVILDTEELEKIHAEQK
ncbi:MAG: pantoate--beta-alanine ligase [Candidatus Omnitrophota bacterium]